MASAKVFLGPAGIPLGSKGSSTIEGIKTVAELNLQAMEVEFVRGVHMSNSMAKECGKSSRELGIGLSIHAPYYVNLSSVEMEKIAASKKRIMDSVERADAMGAKVVVFHPGYYGKMDKEEVFRVTRDACADMIEDMKSKGITDVKLGLETTGKHSAFGTLDELVKLCRQLGVSYCVPVIDFAHLYARQGGKIDYGEVFDKVEPLKLAHIHAHFSNIQFTKAGERSHLVLDGSPAFKPLAEEVLKRKLSITIISESPMLEMDSLKMKATFEHLDYNF